MSTVGATHNINNLLLGRVMDALKAGRERTREERPDCRSFL
jgi:hypothetical protein